jgi:peptide/nickel transport system substrate-binding protein
MKSLLMTAGFLIVASSVFVGCSQRPVKPATPAAAQRGTVVYQASAQDHGPPAGSSGGTLRIASPWDPTTFDLHATSSAYVQFLGKVLFDYLTYLDEEGNPQPWLAKSWEISPDGVEYTFHLRDDVTFSDGTKFNAESVLASLGHMRDPATKSPLAGRYVASYKSGEIVDEYTFRAHLSEPFSAFLEVLAQSWLPMYSAKAIRENPKDLATHPVGSGPFTLESFERQKNFTLVRRPDYNWAPPYIRHQGPAYFDRIDVDVVQEEFVRLGAFTSGQYDLCLEVPPQLAANVLTNPNYILYNQVRKGLPTRAMVFNVEKPPFDDVRVRRALALATDRESITRLDGFGEYNAKSDYLSANTRAYDASYKDVIRYEPAEANRLLDEAGWKDRDAEGYRTRGGVRLGAELLVSDASTAPRAVPIAVQADFKRVGFDLQIRAIPAAQLATRRSQGDYQAVAGGYWQTNTPDGLFIIHSSEEIITPTTFGQNISRLRDAELDRLLSGARQATDHAQELAFHSAAQKRLVELVPSIPLHENHNLLAASRRLHGLLFETSHHAAFLTAAWLEKAP